METRRQDLDELRCHGRVDMAHAFMAITYGQDVAETMARYMENVPNSDPNDDPFATVMSIDTR
ncbi:hypothetical protein PI124_g19094 [Phytophthora idaei]|nr:hypothetical protein PI124_g19094 [Phytophthora idaei]